MQTSKILTPNEWKWKKFNPLPKRFLKVAASSVWSSWTGVLHAPSEGFLLIYAFVQTFLFLYLFLCVLWRFTTKTCTFRNVCQLFELKFGNFSLPCEGCLKGPPLKGPPLKGPPFWISSIFWKIQRLSFFYHYIRFCPNLFCSSTSFCVFSGDLRPRRAPSETRYLSTTAIRRPCCINLCCDLMLVWRVKTQSCYQLINVCQLF